MTGLDVDRPTLTNAINTCRLRDYYDQIQFSRLFITKAHGSLKITKRFWEFKNLLCREYTTRSNAAILLFDLIRHFLKCPNEEPVHRLKPFFNLTLSQTTNLSLFQTERVYRWLSNVMKMAESSPNRKKTLWEKEKLLVTSNFSFFPQCFWKTWTADT